MSAPVPPTSASLDPATTATAATAATAAAAAAAAADAQDPDQTDDQIASAQERLDEQREATLVLPPPSSTSSGDVMAGGEVDAAPAPTVATASGKRGRKSRAAPTDEAEGGGKAKRSRPSSSTAAAAAASSSETTHPTDSNVNVRLERLRLALDRFLDLIEYRVTTAKMAKSLPRMDTEVLEAIRQQFLGQLKDVIKEENENLILENELEPKLAALHRLVREADRRFEKGLRGGEDEVRDVWRPDLDIETAISARAIPDQEQRVAALKRELEEIQQSNAAIHADLKALLLRADDRREQAKETLDALDAAIEALEASPEMEKRIRSTMDGLLADLGART